MTSAYYVLNCQSSMWLISLKVTFSMQGHCDQHPILKGLIKGTANIYGIPGYYQLSRPMTL